MADNYAPKVRRHVRYHLQKTVGGNTQYVKRRPATITGLGAGTVNLRVRHIGETYTNISIWEPKASTNPRPGKYTKM
jgi:hypothetical protein